MSILVAFVTNMRYADGVGVMIEFEVAMRAAWTELDPTHHVTGCLFNLTQVLKPWVE